MNKPGRPPKYPKGTTNMSFSCPNHLKEDITEKLDTLALREGASRSELTVKAILEYIEQHYPGNPQLNLESALGQEPKAPRLSQRLRAREMTEELERMVREWNRAHEAEASKDYIKHLHGRIKQTCVEAARLSESMAWTTNIDAALEEALKIAYPEGLEK